MSWQSLQELASDVQGGGSSVALVRAALSRIAEVDAKGGINAVVVLDAAQALARAADLDRMPPAERRRLPLAGVPVTVKEHIHVAGLPATAGDPARAGPVNASAPVVLALEAAGAVVIGKTNVPLDVADFQSFNAVYGCTSNPHDLSLTPGGSSGGSAAAVAAGLVPTCIGTDIGGSVRVPAHCCGVFAHKPTWGVISKSNGDHAPPKPLSTTGPIARHAADVSLVTRLLFAGARERFGGLAHAVVPEGAATARTSLRGCRVALWADDPVCPVDAAVSSAVRVTVALLEEEGAIVVRTKPAVDSAVLLRCYQECVGDAVDGAAGTRSSAARLETARVQCEIRAAFDDLFRNHDVLLTPTFPVVAFPHDNEDGADRPFYRPSGRTLGTTRLPYHLGCFWPALANLTLLPATAFPVQGEADGMPVALQLIGRELDDYACLKIAELLETAGAGTRVAQFRIPRRLRT